MSAWQLRPVPGVVSVVERGSFAPVILDSPHSGTGYPDDFAPAAPMASIRSGEDSFVDELFDPQDTGAVMIAAGFPRTYIDPNRALTDLDLEMLDGEWPDPVSPGPKAASCQVFSLSRTSALAVIISLT